MKHLSYHHGYDRTCQHQDLKSPWHARISRVLLSSVALCLLAACAHTPIPKHDQVFEQGATLAKVAQQSHDYDNAIELYRKLLAEQHAQATRQHLQLELAQSYFDKGEPEHALWWLNQWQHAQAQSQRKANNNTQQRAALIKGRSLLALEQIQQAEAALLAARALGQEPAKHTDLQHQQVLLSLSSALSLQGKYQDAITVLALAQTWFEFDLKTENNLALNKLLTGDAAAAIALLAPHQSKAGFDAKMQHNLFLAYAMNQQYQQAMALNVEGLNAQQKQHNIAQLKARSQLSPTGDQDAP